MHKTLFVTSEAHPLMKTGGLGDVCGSLPRALRAIGVDVRLMMPAYRDAKAAAGRLRPVARVAVPRLPEPATLLEGTLPGTRVPVWLVDYPPAFDRPGDPYLDPQGQPWYDNAPRFALLARVAVAVARGEATLPWKPDVVHCHDWQTGLVPALLALERERPASVFTIHNLAYQGLFPADMFGSLGLPASLWSLAGLEFHGQMSFIKGGLAYADRLNAVSPTYAREIQTPALGCGLDGLLRHRADRLSGILNGIDVNVWNPARDPHIAAPYSRTRFDGKRINKRALQEMCGLPNEPLTPLLGMVGRLVEQKGVDLVLGAWPALARRGCQLVVLGTGESAYEDAWRRERGRHPAQLAVKIGYDEALAHRIEAGADIFLMPSRFEPCGLNQMYSLRYGTPPVVRRIGGLADTVEDANEDNLASGRATGFVFDEERPEALVAAVERALALSKQPDRWRRLVHTGMRQDFSWERSARAYVRLYDMATEQRDRSV
ncbi:glycogen synthase [Sulfurifustis variabilis]|uniref:Glycogen synthase n=1 Tax=Sulfurifustis variabilis TaxID=1675686 RepID=A0A1B4VC38_9GAMM|nr:glycogen synthase GlgA [Sulfurifustis variabilis]BAU48671.1 glycogen synthase [Sulfurifustis variabilis]